ncbi:hypothetical protein Syun_016008 [Stephania yunnanensis]|uniref:Uncharacterized protein n=1 Tax=Stephania yunnanensis TaxID=152371 RepID=A0AAP0P4G6_9MAGN
MNPLSQSQSTQLSTGRQHPHQASSQLSAFDERVLALRLASKTLHTPQSPHSKYAEFSRAFHQTHSNTSHLSQAFHQTLGDQTRRRRLDTPINHSIPTNNTTLCP